MCSSMLPHQSTTFFLLTIIDVLMTVAYANPRPQLAQPQQIMFEHSEPVQQNHKCREWEWMCEDGIECIAQYDVCDGVSQCSDRSDEHNCMNRYPAEGYHRPMNQMNQQRLSDRQPPHIESAKPSSTSTAAPRKNHENTVEAGELNMKYIFGGLSIFVFVAFVTHALLKRRRRRLGTGSQLNRFRKGESLVDDEDDLLISQMYN